MKRAFLLFLSLLFGFKVFCHIDTIRYETGEIQYINSRHHFVKEFYKNGQLKTYTKSETYLRKGKRRMYDENGKLTVKGKLGFSFTEQGRWVYYSNGKKDSVIHYKYGLKRSELRTPKGKRTKCLLTHGMLARNYQPCEEAIEKYKIQYVAVAGCVVTTQLLFKSNIHNTLLYIRKSLRFGIHWEDKMHSMCSERDIRSKF